MTVSIIIPIYKVEPYIVRCIESVLRQTYRNLEIILVDDCTPDRSMELAKECIKQSSLSSDLSFIYLKHDHNRGLSAARNTGIDAASSDYIYFLDSDDEIIEKCIEILVNAAVRYCFPDIICGAFRVVGHIDVWEKFHFDNLYLIDPHYIRSFFCENKLYVMAWNKMIRRDVICSNNIYFIEGVIHEDVLWSFLMMNKISTLVTLSNRTYLYTQRMDSIMSTEYLNRFENWKRILQEMDKYFAKGCIQPYYENIVFFTQKKYNVLLSVLESNSLSSSYKLCYCFDVVKLRWTVRFLLYFIRYFSKHLVWHLLHK